MVYTPTVSSKTEVLRLDARLCHSTQRARGWHLPVAVCRAQEAVLAYAREAGAAASSAAEERFSGAQAALSQFLSQYGHAPAAPQGTAAQLRQPSILESVPGGAVGAIFAIALSSWLVAYGFSALTLGVIKAVVRARPGKTGACVHGGGCRWCCLLLLRGPLLGSSPECVNGVAVRCILVRAGNTSRHAHCLCSRASPCRHRSRALLLLPTWTSALYLC